MWDGWEDVGGTEMIDEQLLNSLQGTMATIDPIQLKKKQLMSIVWILLRNDLLVLKIRLIYSFLNLK